MLSLLIQRLFDHQFILESKRILLLKVFLRKWIHKHGYIHMYVQLNKRPRDIMPVFTSVDAPKGSTYNKTVLIYLCNLL